MEWYEHDWVKAAATIAGLFLFWKFSQVFFLILLSVLFAVVLASLINFTKRKTGLSRLTSSAITYLIIIAVILGGAMVLTPKVASQYEVFKETLPQRVSELQETYSNVDIPTRVVDPGSYHFFTMETATTTLSSGASVLLDVIFMIILSFYLASNPQTYLKLTKKILSQKQLEAIESDLKWWMAGRLASMVLITILTWAGLYLIGVPFALALGLLAGLLSFIPNLGPIIAYIPAAIISTMVGWNTLLITTFLYIGIQLFESYLVTPQIVKYTVDIKPGISLGLQLIMGTIFGLAGLLLAVPIVVATKAYWQN